MKLWKSTKDEEIHGGVKPATPPPKPKPDDKNHRPPLRRVEVVFVSGMTRTFVGETVKFGGEITIWEQGTQEIINIPIRNVLYYKASTVKEERNGISIQR